MGGAMWTGEEDDGTHALQFARALRLGERWNKTGTHWDRVRNSLRTKFCLAIPVSGYPKNHKLIHGREYI